MTINNNILNEINKDLSFYNNAKLMIVTKNQSIQDIESLISKGYKLFGENRVQEAKQKYEQMLIHENLELHMIGPLQTNKVKMALKIFDTIQSIDRYSLVDEICKVSSKNICRTKKFYIQVNIGDENQKSGVHVKDLNDLYTYSIKKKLQIIGLMCIPPDIEDPSEYFELMKNIRDKIDKNLNLSMGMSNDYKIALNYNSNMIRIGSLIFS